jgi:hypothetical protein
MTKKKERILQIILLIFFALTLIGCPRKPVLHNSAEAWFNKGVEFAQLGKYSVNMMRKSSVMNEKEKSLSDLKRAIELNSKYKEDAKKDKGFKNLWDDEDFKKIVE